MVTSSAVSRSICVVYDDRRQARIQLARMFAEVPGVRRVIPVSSVDGLVSLAGEPGAVVVVGTRRPASVGADAIRRVLALRSGAAVVVVGGGEDARPVSSAVAAGAVGFLRWDAAPLLVRTLVDSLAGGDPGQRPCSTPDGDRTRGALDHASGPPPVFPVGGSPGERQAACTVPSDLGISRRELQDPPRDQSRIQQPRAQWAARAVREHRQVPCPAAVLPPRGPRACPCSREGLPPRSLRPLPVRAVHRRWGPGPSGPARRSPPASGSGPVDEAAPPGTRRTERVGWVIRGCGDDPLSGLSMGHIQVIVARSAQDPVPSHSEVHPRGSIVMAGRAIGEGLRNAEAGAAEFR